MVLVTLLCNLVPAQASDVDEFFSAKYADLTLR